MMSKRGRCLWCGASIVVGSKGPQRLYCGGNCRQYASRARKPVVGPLAEKVCRCCGRLFVPSKYNPAQHCYCCSGCKQKFWRDGVSLGWLGRGSWSVVKHG